MAEAPAGKVYAKAPDGSIVLLPAEMQQDALNEGYTTPTPEETGSARDEAVRTQGAQGAVQSGLLEAPADYSVAGALGRRALSTGSFGLLANDAPGARAEQLRVQEEHPVGTFAADVAGSLPLMAATGAVGAAATGAAEGAGLAARAAATGLDWGANALVGGAQLEGQQAQLQNREFSWTDAAVTGLAGEVLGRGSAHVLGAAYGATKNLLGKAERRVVAEDAASSLSRGGILNDYRVTQHAETYQNELADLAARDLDELEPAFEEVSRQDRKRARIVRTVTDQPEVQRPIREQAYQDLSNLREALAGELTDGGPAARSLARQLDERLAALEASPAGSGKKLWRLLDENRQALQEYRLDLHQAYEDNPGSAWLSREGLAQLDAAEKSTRESLLREDAWGADAARMQAEYNVPFNEKYFPTVKTVRNRLMFSPYKNERGFNVFRGDPEKLRSFFTRDLSGPDGARLAEQFTDYLDGVGAIARAGQGDAPASARTVLEKVRRLRKATANARFVAEAAERTGRRADVAGVVSGGAAGAALGGPVGGLGGMAAARGARTGDWLMRISQRLGWGAGKAESMARLLEKDALPAAAGADRRVESMLEDLGGAGPSEPPPSGGGGPGGAPPAPGGGGGGLTPSMAADAQRGSWTPSGPPEGGGGGAGATHAEVGPEGDALPDVAEASATPARPGRAERAARETQYVGEREVHRNQQPAMEMDGLRDHTPARRRDEARVQALTKGEFADVVGQLKASGEDDFARELERRESELVDAGFISDAQSAEAVSSRPTPPTPPDASTPPAPAGGLFSHTDTSGLASAAAFYEKKAASVSPDLAKFVEKNKASIRAAKQETANWWEQLVAEPAKAEAPQPKPWWRNVKRELADAGEVAPERAPGTGFDGDGPSGGIFAKPMYGQGGVTKGGFFQGSDGVVRYAKFADRYHQLTEWANNQAYRDFGVNTIEQKIVPLEVSQDMADRMEMSVDELKDLGRGDQPIALVSEKLPESMRPAEGLQRAKVQPEAVQEYIRGVPADIVLGNWDIANNAGNILTNGRRLMRIDAGEAGANSLFVPQAKSEWESVLSILKAEDANNPAPTIQIPHMLMHGQALADAKAPLEEGLAKIKAVVQRAGGMEPYVAAKFSHLDQAQQTQLAKDMQKRLSFLEQNLPEIAGLALWVGASALLPNKDTDAASPAAVVGLGLFARRAGAFQTARGKLIRDVARRFFAGTGEALLRSTARLTYSRAQIERRQEELQSWQADPQALVQRVAEGLRDAPPEAFSKISTGVFAAASFLREKLPTNARPSPVAIRALPVSSEAAAKYARYEQAALDPQDALHEASESGYLSQELRETLQALYPDLLAELRVQAYQAVRAGGPALSVQAKTQYAALFDGDGAVADPAFSAETAQMAQLAYEQQTPTKAGPTGAGPRPGVSQVAGAVSPPRGLGPVA